MEDQKVVVMGGGTGIGVLLRGLKQFPADITAIVTVADDGGSSGRLRKEFNIPPPGDVRNVLVALAEVEPLIEELFQHRFTSGEGLTGHSLGNLLVAGMTSITGDFAKGITELSTVLNVRGKVLPASNRSIELFAKMKDGSTVYGESLIPKAGKQIDQVFIHPPDAEALPETVRAIEQADVIVIGPGSLFTSIMPNLIVPGIRDAINRSGARKVYICNVMTQPGETDGFSAADHLHAIEKHTGGAFVDTVLVHNGEIPAPVLANYEKQQAFPVKCDYERLEQIGCRVVTDTFMHYDGLVLRHNAKKVSEALLARD
ncbi:gluconeogenesis factor YvcK family protein [Marinococcus luteus]|uniref:gluconeogenesis factor YvcK family protein n=1 Tax=Marinococcus luteus TaxID=1122204 RepID=UPI002ACC810D|nr:YvcK family protein [Marinococcus luteus]MDZ5783614.1 YvcK family protein [Marinococcus luteus]